MKKIAVLLIFAGCFFAAAAQDSLKYQLADYYHDKGNEFFDAKEYDSACKYSNLHLDIELTFDKPRGNKIILDYIHLALCEFLEGRYKSSIEIYNQSLKWMTNEGSAEFASSFFDFIDLCYQQIESTDSVYYHYTDKDYRKNFIFTIDSVLWRKGATFRVKINAGLNDGLIMGAVAFPISAPLPDSVPQRLFQLGKGEIVSIGPWSAEAEVTVYDSNDTYNWVQAGDVLETRIFSKFKDETIIYQLLANDISFMDNYRERMVSPRYIIHYDSKPFKDLLLMLMASEIFDTEEFTREGAMFLDPAPKGQNQGYSIHDMFLNPDTSDIVDFFEFVQYFPRKYIGKNFKVNETYATWLLNNSPSTPTVVLDSLVNENELLRRKEIFEFNREDLLEDEEFYDKWGEIATDYADKQLYDEALKVNDRLLEIAGFINDFSIQTFAYNNRAKILKSQKVYDQAIEYFNLAEKGYEKLKDTVNQVRAIYKMADTYGDWGRYKQSVEKFDQAIAKLTKKIGKKGNYDQWELMAYILWDKGYTISDRGDYDGALKAYNQALKILDSIGGSKSDRANVYRNVAYVSKKKGQYENALEKYRESMALFLEAGNQQKYATLHDDIADTYFKMGQYRDAIWFYQKAYDLKLILDDKSGAGFSQSNIGQAYWNLGNYDSAIQMHTEAIVLRKAGNDIEGTAYSYEKIADLWKENGNFDSAIQYYQTAEAYYIKNNDTTDKLAELKGSVASLYATMKNYQQAVYFYERKLQIFSAIGNELGVANAYYDIGVNYYYMSSFQQSEEYLLKAKAAYEKMKDKENIMYTLTWLSCIDRDGKSDFVSAEKHMKQALLLAKETESFSNQAYAWRVMGNLTLEQGKLEKAKKYYDSSLQFYNKLGNYEGAAYTKSAMAKYYIEKGQFQTARNLFWEGVDSGRQAKNFMLVSDIYVDLVHYYNLVGEYDSAKYIGQQALDLNKEINNPYVEAGAYVNLGNTYNYLSNNKTAVAYYATADTIYQEIKFSLGRTVPVNNIGTIYFAQGDYTNALIQFDMAWQEHLKTGYRGEGYLSGMLNIGEVYYEDGLLTEAESWITKGLKESQKLGSQRKIAGAWLMLGKLRLKQGRHKEANGGLNNALKIYNAMGETDAIIEASAYLSKLYFETKKYDSARIHINKSVALCEQTGSTRMLWLPLQTSANIYLEKKDTAKAIADLIRSVEVVENLKTNIAGRSSNLVKFAKAQDKYKIYEKLVELLVARNDIKTAFYYQEKANFAGLKELTRGGDEGGTRTNELLGDAEETAAKELELKIDGYYAELIKEKSKPKDQQSPEKIKALQDLIDVNEADFVNFLDSAITAQDGSEHQNFSNTINPAELDQDRFSLDDNEVVVEYLATENQLLIFVASNNSLNARKVAIREADLNKAIEEFYLQVSTSKSDRKLLDANTEKLYQVFISPVEDLLEGKTKIAMVPTGEIYRVPMQALGRMENGNMKYLIASYDITYITNTRQADATGKLDVRGLIFGNPDKTLDNAEKEANEILAIFPGSTVFVRDSATEDKAKQLMVKYNVVHFATHGHLNPVAFLTSYLVMAPSASSGDDGRLTIGEITSFKTLGPIKLLVLSACDMAVKSEKKEGWVNTPVHAFVKKGVGTAVAPLWKVHDEATSLLMIDFYSNLQAGMGISEALKNSQLKLAQNEKFSHPYYWSAFETVGKW